MQYTIEQEVEGLVLQGHVTTSCTPEVKGRICEGVGPDMVWSGRRAGGYCAGYPLQFRSWGRVDSLRGRRWEGGGMLAEAGAGAIEDGERGGGGGRGGGE